MRGVRFTRIFIVTALLLSGLIVSCQKDQDDVAVQSSAAKTDTSLTLAGPGNYLALKGTLKITIEDSTYTFDAAVDSIAFVNVRSGNGQYFGITAINKAHSMSFGISSSGYAATNLVSPVAGGQFLLSEADKPNTEYALPKLVSSGDFGKISIITFKQDSVLAKGTFYTFLSKDDKPGTASKVKGTFNLQLK